jgi:uncharacterized protein DUF5957
LVCGFLDGAIISEIIGRISVPVSHQAVGIRFLTVYLAGLSGARTHPGEPGWTAAR